MNVKKNLIFLICFSLFFLTVSYSKELMFFTQDFAPFNYLEKGKVAGPVAEIINLVCKEMGIDPKFKLLPWTKAINNAKDGDANALFVVGWNKDRTSWLHFSLPILNTEYGLFFRSDSKIKYRTIEDLKGLKIGVYGPSNTSKSLLNIKKEIGEITIEMDPDDLSVFKKLSAGKIDAVYSNRDVGYSILKELNISNIKYFGKHRDLKYFIGFVKKTTPKKIVKRFNEVYRNLYKSGKIKKILNKAKMTIASLD